MADAWSDFEFLLVDVADACSTSSESELDGVIFGEDDPRGAQETPRPAGDSRTMTLAQERDDDLGSSILYVTDSGSLSEPGDIEEPLHSSAQLQERDEFATQVLSSDAAPATYSNSQLQTSYSFGSGREWPFGAEFDMGTVSNIDNTTDDSFLLASSSPHAVPVPSMHSMGDTRSMGDHQSTADDHSMEGDGHMYSWGIFSAAHTLTSNLSVGHTAASTPGVADESVVNSVDGTLTEAPVTAVALAEAGMSEAALPDVDLTRAALTVFHNQRPPGLDLHYDGDNQHPAGQLSDMRYRSDDAHNSVEFKYVSEAGGDEQDTYVHDAIPDAHDRGIVDNNFAGNPAGTAKSGPADSMAAGGTLSLLAVSPATETGVEAKVVAGIAAFLNSPNMHGVNALLNSPNDVAAIWGLPDSRGDKPFDGCVTVPLFDLLAVNPGVDTNDGASDNAVSGASDTEPLSHANELSDASVEFWDQTTDVLDERGELLHKIRKGLDVSDECLNEVDEGSGVRGEKLCEVHPGLGASNELLAEVVAGSDKSDELLHEVDERSGASDEVLDTTSTSDFSHVSVLAVAGASTDAGRTWNLPPNTIVLASPRALSPRYTAPSKVSAQEVSAMEMSAQKLSERQVSLIEVSGREFSPREVVSRPLSAREIAPREVSSREVCLREVHAKNPFTRNMFHTQGYTVQGSSAAGDHAVQDYAPLTELDHLIFSPCKDSMQPGEIEAQHSSDDDQIQHSVNWSAWSESGSRGNSGWGPMFGEAERGVVLAVPVSMKDVDARGALDLGSASQGCVEERDAAFVAGLQEEDAAKQMEEACAAFVAEGLLADAGFAMGLLEDQDGFGPTGGDGLIGDVLLTDSLTGDALTEIGLVQSDEGGAVTATMPCMPFWDMEPHVPRPDLAEMTELTEMETSATSVQPSSSIDQTSVCTGQPSTPVGHFPIISRQLLIQDADLSPVATELDNVANDRYPEPSKKHASDVTGTVPAAAPSLVSGAPAVSAEMVTQVRVAAAHGSELDSELSSPAEAEPMEGVEATGELFFKSKEGREELFCQAGGLLMNQLQSPSQTHSIARILGATQHRTNRSGSEVVSHDEDEFADLVVLIAPVPVTGMDRGSGMVRRAEVSRAGGWLQVHGTTQQVQALGQRVHSAAQHVQGLGQQVQSAAQQVQGLSQRVQSPTQQLQSPSQQVQGPSQSPKGRSQAVQSCMQHVQVPTQVVQVPVLLHGDQSTPRKRGSRKQHGMEVEKPKKRKAVAQAYLEPAPHAVTTRECPSSRSPCGPVTTATTTPAIAARTVPSTTPITATVIVPTSTRITATTTTPITAPSTTPVTTPAASLSSPPACPTISTNLSSDPTHKTSSLRTRFSNSSSSPRGPTSPTGLRRRAGGGLLAGAHAVPPSTVRGPHAPMGHRMTRSNGPKELGGREHKGKEKEYGEKEGRGKNEEYVGKAVSRVSTGAVGAAGGGAAVGDVSRGCMKRKMSEREGAVAKKKTKQEKGARRRCCKVGWCPKWLQDHFHSCPFIINLAMFYFGLLCILVLLWSVLLLLMLHRTSSPGAAAVILPCHNTSGGCGAGGQFTQGAGAHMAQAHMTQGVSGHLIHGGTPNPVAVPTGSALLATPTKTAAAAGTTGAINTAPSSESAASATDDAGASSGAHEGGIRAAANYSHSEAGDPAVGIIYDEDVMYHFAGLLSSLHRYVNAVHVEGAGGMLERVSATSGHAQRQLANAAKHIAACRGKGLPTLMPQARNLLWGVRHKLVAMEAMYGDVEQALIDAYRQDRKVLLHLDDSLDSIFLSHLVASDAVEQERQHQQLATLLATVEAGVMNVSSRTSSLITSLSILRDDVQELRSLTITQALEKMESARTADKFQGWKLKDHEKDDGDNDHYEFSKRSWKNRRNARFSKKFKRSFEEMLDELLDMGGYPTTHRGPTTDWLQHLLSALEPGSANTLRRVMEVVSECDAALGLVIADLSDVLQRERRVEAHLQEMHAAIDGVQFLLAGWHQGQDTAHTGWSGNGVNQHGADANQHSQNTANQGTTKQAAASQVIGTPETNSQTSLTSQTNQASSRRSKAGPFGMVDGGAVEAASLVSTDTLHSWVECGDPLSLGAPSNSRIAACLQDRTRELQARVGRMLQPAGL